jgi:hypothetical protein
MSNESEYQDAYEQWLLKHRRQDNATNTIAFAAYWDEQLRKKEQ